MVMENLLFGHNISRIYDLKGATFSRRVADSNDHDTVYLDQNYVEDMGVSPIYIGGRTKHLLQRAIWNDTAFLTVRISLPQTTCKMFFQHKYILL
jgi:1-phosphatidylinositol-3-phosphate 5-kinase